MNKTSERSIQHYFSFYRKIGFEDAFECIVLKSIGQIECIEDNKSKLIYTL